LAFQPSAQPLHALREARQVLRGEAPAQPTIRLGSESIARGQTQTGLPLRPLAPALAETVARQTLGERLQAELFFAALRRTV
jgi:hypothetical protein